MRNKHKDKRKDICNICDNELSSKEKLNYHIISKHGEEQQVLQRRSNCKIWDKVSASKDALMKHMRRKHDK